MRLFPESRKGVELAINTVVVLILGIVIVGAGITMVWKLVEGGTDLVTTVTDSQIRLLEEQLNNGQLVAVAPESIEVRAGDRGTVAFGVRSILSTQQTFLITIVGTGPDGLAVPRGEQSGAWRVNYFPDLEVEAQKYASGTIDVYPSETAPQGIYTFIVTAKMSEDSPPYESPRFFTVRVR